MIKRHDKIERSLSSTDEETVKTELKHMTSELNSLVKFTRRLSTAVDDTVIETNTEMHYKQITAAAHSTMLAQLHAISAITDTITRARSAIVISKANLTIATDGAETEDKQFSETNVASAESGIIVAEGGYRGALVNLEKTKIKAPFNGFVTALSVSNGDFINTSSTIGTLLDTSNYEVQFPVPINNVPLLDQEIIVKIKDETYKAYITEIPKITTNKTPLVTITAKIENVKITQQITSGLSVDIYYKKDTIQSHSEKQVIFAVPLNAITFKESKPFVFILNKNIYNNTKSDTETATTTKSTTTVESIEVILGELSNDKINIRSSTLTPGTLIVRDARKIQPGTIVCTDK
jgi:multidrug efflux pump subunit AcrA (membrane-fusion protein)